MKPVTFAAVVAAVVGLGAATGVAAQDQAGWRTVAPENLLVIDTAKGRILAELSPEVAPNHVERVRTLASTGFYDGLKFHRVIEGFMAQTGDPLGTGEGGSDLPDVNAEFSFRRRPNVGFTAVGSHPEGGLMGVLNGLPIRTQPDAQAMVNADFKVPAIPLFCPGVLGMARAAEVNSANSQFFIMTGRNDRLNGQYTAFGRVLSGMTVVRSLKLGSRALDGKVEGDPDVMTRVRMASDMAEAERPTARVMDVTSPAFAAIAEQARSSGGRDFNVCDIDTPAQID
ncbi:MAG: peptidylprolyl isomerase [Brevundimonas sp.]|uniref:peptidylprolyl isomerase n=1 Tax=Brevundimonas sp. TaxID=1871086 RepID=UPI0025C37F3B|nr:peptidylprolyl isomerase [Brevundimonas sp.]MBX3477833.1 peptidylprolyl isomerase [Brevundimonas sp.]